jgi:bla regulator protein BlaR1
MANRLGAKLSCGRKLLLACVGALGLAGPVVVGLINAAAIRAQSSGRFQFEVTSVKPHQQGDRQFAAPQFLPGDRFTSRAPLALVIALAYDLSVQNPRVSGALPDWIISPDSAYDIEATVPGDVLPATLSKKDRTDREKSMLQSLLADRFKIVVHRERKEMPVYALVVGKGGPKLEKADIDEKDCPATPDGPPTGDGTVVCHRFNGGRGRGLHARAVDMADLVSWVEAWTDRPLLDKTGIKGLYKIETTPWLPMEVATTSPPPGTKQDGADVSDLTTIFTVFERLGLKMEPRKDQVEFVVIDHIEKPTAN